MLLVMKTLDLKTLGLVLAAIASMAWANTARAAAIESPTLVTSPDSTQKPIEQVEELDEVWVHGRRLSEVIEDAEDDFFLLYNKLNKESQYDVFCGRLSLNSSSMIMVRRCVPGFIVYNFGEDYGGVKISCPSSSSPIYTADIPYARAMPCLYRPAFASPSVALSVSTADQLIVRGPAYSANVVKVVRSDPRLLEKLRNLDGLYHEMDVVQRRYVMIKGDSPPPRASRKGATINPGPRNL
jgi:hypothetical protein